MLALRATIAWRLLEGPSWSWDRGHYHAYAGYAWAEGLVGRGFLPMGGQSFLNPLPYVPAWLLTRAGWGETGTAAAAAAWPGLAGRFVWLTARHRVGPGRGPWLAGRFRIPPRGALCLACTTRVACPHALPPATAAAPAPGATAPPTTVVEGGSADESGGGG